MTEPAQQVVSRARLSGGSSNEAIYAMVARAIAANHQGRGLIVDVGCGSGNLHGYVGAMFDRYVGADALRYEGFPEAAELVIADLEQGTIPLPSAVADVVVAIETIEHLENPRAFARELTRLAKPGGWVIITTPNQLSLHSKACLVLKHRFAAFQEVHYPAHLTALLEVDLQRIAHECGLSGIQIRYSETGRMAFTAQNYPRFISRRFSRSLSDNVLLMARKCSGAGVAAAAPADPTRA